MAGSGLAHSGGLCGLRAKAFHFSVTPRSKTRPEVKFQFCNELTMNQVYNTLAVKTRPRN